MNCLVRKGAEYIFVTYLSPFVHSYEERELRDWKSYLEKKIQICLSVVFLFFGFSFMCDILHFVVRFVSTVPQRKYDKSVSSIR